MDHTTPRLPFHEFTHLFGITHECGPHCVDGQHAALGYADHPITPEEYVAHANTFARHHGWQCIAAVPAREAPPANAMPAHAAHIANGLWLNPDDFIYAYVLTFAPIGGDDPRAAD